MMAVASSTRLYIHKNRKQDVWLPRPPGAIKSQEIQHQELTEEVANKQERRNLSPKSAIATRQLPGYPQTWITQMTMILPS